MKRLQNKIPQISTNLIQNLKIKILSKLALKSAFFENHQLCIEAYRYQIISYQFLASIFPSKTILVPDHFTRLSYLLGD
jgi:hypothetical protein